MTMTVVFYSIILEAITGERNFTVRIRQIYAPKDRVELILPVSLGVLIVRLPEKLMHEAIGSS